MLQHVLQAGYLLLVLCGPDDLLQLGGVVVTYSKPAVGQGVDDIIPNLFLNLLCLYGGKKTPPSPQVLGVNRCMYFLS